MTFLSSGVVSKKESRLAPLIIQSTRAETRHAIGESQPRVAALHNVFGEGRRQFKKRSKAHGVSARRIDMCEKNECRPGALLENRPSVKSKLTGRAGWCDKTLNDSCCLNINIFQPGARQDPTNGGRNAGVSTNAEVEALRYNP